MPPGSLDYWESRLRRYGARLRDVEVRFGQKVLPIVDPHGLRVALVEADAPRRFTPFDGSPVPPERQVRGLHGAQLWERDALTTTTFLTTILGLRRLGSENGWARYGLESSAGAVDVRETPGMRRGAWGVGCVHHMAWRVEDEEHQMEMRTRLETAGVKATPVIDRFWFKSVYFHEPGGVLFELATDGPGFAVDEDRDHLGESLVLPPWLEPARAEIEHLLPPLSRPVPAATGPRDEKWGRE